MAVPQSQAAGPSLAPRQHSAQADWTTARLGSAGSESSFSLPLTTWRLSSGPEGARIFPLPLENFIASSIGIWDQQMWGAHRKE